MSVLLAAALLTLPTQAPARLELSRGMDLASGGLKYWAVEDTTLDSRAPEENSGGSGYLFGGTGRTILIRFGDLRRAIGPGRRVAKASILFTLTGGQAAPMGRAAEVLVPWGEGPAQVVGFGVAASPAHQAGAANWRLRRAGEPGIGWQASGAMGLSDARPIPAARAVPADADHVRITGLEAALQRQYERPFGNHGFAFSFDGNIEFASSQSATGRPVLELELENAPLAEGPDLAVVRIERTPEYPRYAPPAQTHRAAQDGVEVAIPGEPANRAAKTWPDPGEEVTYTAFIKNLGNRAATGFSARWIARERSGGSAEYARTVEPGGETTLTFKTPFRVNQADHRLHPVALVIEPTGPDAEPANNGLSIEEAALSVGFRLAPGVAEAIARDKPLGARNTEEWAQAVVGLWNETIFPQSRFSFAPNGPVERLRLQRVQTVSEVALEFAPYEDPNLDLAIAIRGDAKLGDPAAMLRLLKTMGHEMGLADLATMNLGRPDKPGLVSLGGQIVERYAPDLFPGLMGGGDTRFEGNLPGMLILPQRPTVNPIFDVLPVAATDLLSATDVAALNLAMGHRRGFAPGALAFQPTSVILKLVDGSGLPIANAPVEIFAMAGGGLRATEPIAKLQSSPAGNVTLPSRPSQLPAEFKTLFPVPAASPFGRTDGAGSNGVLAVRVASPNPGYAFLKAWQVADSFRRDPSPVIVFELRVEAGAEVDRAQNLAKNRIVNDSTSLLPAQLAPLVDEMNGAGVEFKGGKDAWVEIDLGRDRIFGEVQLSAAGPFWEKFNILAYATGQTVLEAKVLAREASWSWSAANRSDAEGSGRSVGYPNFGIRARYIRLVRTSEGPPGSLSEVKVFALKGP